MISVPLVLLLALTAPLDAKRSVPVTRGPAATDDASAATSPLGDAELRDQVESFLGSLHQAVPAEQWRALGPGAVPLLESIVRDGGTVPSRRAAALDALSLVGGERARQLVLEVARSEDETFAVRATALRSAPRVLSSKELTSELRPVLEGARQSRTRATAADVIASRGVGNACAVVRAQVEREGTRERGQFKNAIQRCAGQQP